MSVFSVETLLYAVVQRYGWENAGQPGRQLTLTREDLDEIFAAHELREKRLPSAVPAAVVLSTEPPTPE